jgi:hypothetical protein
MYVRVWRCGFVRRVTMRGIIGLIVTVVVIVLVLRFMGVL